MIGVHVLIGIGEGIITALAVGAVMAHAARPRLRRPRASRPPPAPTAAPTRGGLTWHRRRLSIAAFVAAGLARRRAARGVRRAPRQLEPRRAGEGRRRHGHRRATPRPAPSPAARSPTTASTGVDHDGARHRRRRARRRRRDVRRGAPALVLRASAGGDRPPSRAAPTRRADVGGAAPAPAGARRGTAAPPRPAVQAAGDGAVRRSPSWPRRRSSSGRSACSPGWSCWRPLIGRVPLLGVARRLVIEVPFLLFAVLLPLLGRDRTRRGARPAACREPGLWAAWNIVAKGTIGVAASIVLASTTSVPHLLAGLERLRVPRQLVAITGFMVRYGDVIGDELRRMRIARESRGAGGELARARQGGGDVGRRAVRALLRARRAGVPGDGVARLRRHDAGAQRAGHVAGVGRRACCGRRSPRPSRRSAWRVAVVTRARGPRPRVPLPGRPRRARRRRPRRRARRAGRRARARTAPARRRSCSPSTASTRPAAGTRHASAASPSTKANLAEIRRRVGIVFQDPDDQLFMPTVRDDVAFGPANLGLRGDELAARDGRGAGRRRDGPRRRPVAAPPQLRRAPPRRAGHGAGDAPRRARARRAVVEPRPGGPAGAGRDRARPRRHDDHGHPRPARTPCSCAAGR